MPNPGQHYIQKAKGTYTLEAHSGVFLVGVFSPAQHLRTCDTTQCLFAHRMPTKAIFKKLLLDKSITSPW